MDNKDLKKVVESALDKQKVPHVKLKKRLELARLMLLV